MNEVRGLVEAALAGELRGVVDCPVVCGDAEGERPDQYVAVVAGMAEARGVGAYLVQVEVRVVAPMDDSKLAALSRVRLREICDYLDDPACNFKHLQTDEVIICGYYLGSMESQKGSRSKAEIIRLKIGAAAVVSTQES